MILSKIFEELSVLKQEEISRQKSESLTDSIQQYKKALESEVKYAW
jgi:hypothetical protein